MKKIMAIKKEILIEYLLVNSILLILAVSFISSYSHQTILIKTFALIITLIFLVMHFRREKINFDKVLKTLQKLSISKSILLIDLFFIATLAYSANFKYGLFKIIQINISSIPMFIICILIKDLSFQRLKNKFLNSIYLWVFILVSLSIIIGPFNQSSVYSISWTRWSHVVIGRVEFVFLLLLIVSLLENEQTQKSRKFHILSVFLLIIGIPLTGLRAVIISMIIFVPVLIIFGLMQKKLLKSLSVMLTIAVFSSPFLSQFLNISDTSEKRIKSLIMKSEEKFIEDASVSGRMESYLFAIKQFCDSPIFGKGIGGFNDPKVNLKSAALYPHNIILEAAAEYGLIGIGLLLFYLIKMFSCLLKKSFSILMLFTAILILALTSKDIPGNSILFLGLLFFDMDRNNLKKYIRYMN